MCRKYVVLMLAALVMFSGCGREQTKETPEISSVSDTLGESIAESSPEEWEKAAQEAGKASKDTSQYGKAEDWVTGIPEDAIYLTGKGDAVDISGGSVQAGAVTITEAGTYEITAKQDAVQGKDSVTIVDGIFSITAGNDAIKASNDTDTEKGWVTIVGGTYAIVAEDDAIHAETDLVIEDGTIDIKSCYEGIEGLRITLNGGQISLKAEDDGINAAGGDSGESSARGAFDSNPDAYVEINGGNIFVDAEGDGIDSNGTLTVNGGTVFIEGPEKSGIGGRWYLCADCRNRNCRNHSG